ncbi:MAG: DUF2382 domain-containing protein [Cyanobacteria bacterium J06638_28]
MALLKLTEAYPNYREAVGEDSNIADFDNYSVYADKDNKVGSIKDVLFEDTTGNIRYLIVDTGFWVFGKNVLLPIGLARFDHAENRIYVNNLTQKQVENLPEYTDNITIDRKYEDSVRDGYRTLGDARKRQFMGKEYEVDKYRAYPGSAALHGVTEQPAGTASAMAGTANTNLDMDAYDYDREPGLYAMDEAAHQPIRLYQERLIADKDRFKAGTVAVGKQVKTDTQEVSVPVQNERVVIERTTPGTTKPVTTMPDFKEGEVARVETYAEEADIRKEAFVREEVSVRKEVDRETVTGRETVRREELDVNTKGDPTVTRR